MTAYIKQLKQEFEQQESVSDSKPAPDLRQRFLDWYSALPEITRSRAFAMKEFEAALSTQGKYLSGILLELGWMKKRRWTAGGQHNRYWVPPTPNRLL